jgi:hypothetical protein
MIMPKRPPMLVKKISAKEMKDAIQASGYLVEQRVEQIIMKEGYYVETNPAFPDPDTGKSCEFDIKVLEYEIADDYAGWDDWVLPRKAEEEDISIQAYYPLLILQGDLYSVTTTKRGVSLKKVKHIQFRKESFLPKPNKKETYQIDVITEDYLRDYLKIVASEMQKVIKVFKRKRKEVLKSIEKIVKELKAHKKKLKSYREYLEF